MSCARGDFGEAAPAAADLQHVGAGRQAQLIENPYVLCLLGVGQRALRIAVEQRRRIAHRRVEPELIEVVAQIVVRDDVLARAPSRIAAQQVLEPECELPPPLTVEGKLQGALIEGDDGQQRVEIVGLPAAVHVRFGERDIAAGDDVAAEFPVADRQVGLSRNGGARTGRGTGAEATGDAVRSRQHEPSIVHAFEQGEEQPAYGGERGVASAGGERGMKGGHRVVLCNGG